MDLDIFAQRLKELRSTSSKEIIYQTKLAEDLNISLSSISQYENGVRYPDVETLIKFSDYFRVSTDYLLGKSDFKNSEEEIKIKNILDSLDENLNKLESYEKETLIKTIITICETLLKLHDNYSLREKYLFGLSIIALDINSIISLNSMALKYENLKDELNISKTNLAKKLIQENFYREQNFSIFTIQDIYKNIEKILEQSGSLNINEYKDHTEKINALKKLDT